MRDLVIEGIDGSGKTTLIQAVLNYYPNHRLHTRASTSTGGPVPQVGDWVVRDHEQHDKGPWVYDRHPLVSETIYGPLLRPEKLEGGVWTNPAWVDAYRRQLAARSVLVLCQPPYNVVRDTLHAQGADAHMPGVLYKSLDIYMRYATLMWPGLTIRYDYTRDTFQQLVLILDKAVF